MSLPRFQKELGQEWTIIAGSDHDIPYTTFSHITDDFRGSLLNINQVDRWYSQVDMQAAFDWSDEWDDKILSMIKSNRCISRVLIHRRWDDRHQVVYCYRVKPHEFRMMQLLAEPPVPKDILRHIYSFIRK